ncbi:hypothetical protein B9Y88_11090 [Stenotrophomonas maltophilia]|uniref:hypothetical protein n=1 Tax=Stenotrophomonas TaxID=40323 RepID=UPI000C25797A|nr:MULTISPECIES: hypothetical protein [unclassified Stenotrophomonas]MCU1057229.1 hypothetical protein [Stenotrophomonas maltophilia]MDH1242459.1 hypothetical protein [Stenotrophomonas sp. GD03948]MDH1576931.1 hypothetical protein [Stenotrophomonas sp. GD03744]PJL76475.1 hypothetical protein B9Y88_11090 [Stenotrophomonas maltophilia]PZT30354.1 hypothetical protein A7X94_04140 [Stenotrophomonas maltophilia]
MAWCRWAANALCLVVVVAARTQWPATPAPSPVAFQNINDDRLSQLRRQAMQFVESQPRQGFQFVERRRDAEFQVHCRGIPVLWLEGRSHHLLLQVSLDAEQRAPAVVQLGTLLQWQLEPVGYLEQVLADVPEPVLSDRVLQMFGGGVPEGARCGPHWSPASQALAQ